MTVYLFRFFIRENTVH